MGRFGPIKSVRTRGSRQLLWFAKSLDSAPTSVGDGTAFPQLLPFLLNFWERQTRYYRHTKQNRRALMAGASWRSGPKCQGWNCTMSVTKHYCFLALVAMMWVGAARAQAQLFRPFAFPPVTSDFQFFAPNDIDTFGGRPTYRTGWYGSYDRLYINVSRPEYQLVDRGNNQPATNLASDRVGDFTWGTQFEVGYVDDDRKGWAFRYFRVGGPQANENDVVERLTRFTTPPDPDDDPASPPGDQNNYRYLYRAYDVSNSINVGKLHSLELNRTWLWKPLHYGGTLEPFAGFRYVQFTNLIRRMEYQRYDNAGVPVPPDNPSQAAQDAAESEALTTDDRFFTNDMIGGQLGIRWSKLYRRWNFYGDTRFFAFQNFQTWDRNWLRVHTFYGGQAIDDLPTSIRVQRQSDGASANEFVWGGEARINAAFQVTRDFALRVGFDCVYFGQGIGRGYTVADNSEDLLLFGVNFGATLNR